MKVFLLLLAAAGACAAQTDSFDVMIEGAVDFEIQPLLTALANKSEVRIGAWTYWTGMIGKRHVVVARTEMGPANASASTALGISRFHPRAVINQGTAGAHIPGLRVFDIVIGEKTIDYGAVRSDHVAAGGGIHVNQWTSMSTELRLNGSSLTQFPYFAGDEKLAAAAMNTPYEHGKLVKGTIGSAYQFNRELDYIHWVHETFHTDSEDMESAFAAAVAKGLDVPFLAVRVISDSEFNHPALEKAAGAYCAEFVVRMVREWR